MKRNIWILIIAAAVFVLCAALVPLLVQAGRFRPTVETRLSASLGRPVQIGKLGFSWLAGGMSARDITIGEDPAFGTAPFLRARALDVNVAMWQLLRHGELRIESIKVRDPEVRLQEIGGRWNVSSLGRTQAASGAASSGTRKQPLSLRKLVITGGRLLVSSQTYADVKITATDIVPGRAVPFTVTATTPGSGKLKAKGTIGPIGDEFSSVPFEAKLQVEQLDLGGSGYFGQGSDIAGTAKLNATLRSDGRATHIEGDATAENLRLMRSGNAMRPEARLTFAADYDRNSEFGRLTQGDVRIGKGRIGLSGSFDLRNTPAVVQMTADAQKFPMTEVQQILPALGLALPGGASLQDGTAATTMTISGPLNRLVISGPLRLADVTVSGFDLGSNLKAVATLAGIHTGRDTRIESLTCNYRVAPEGIAASDMDASIAGLGTLSGGGTIAVNRALDFRMTARLSQGGGLFGALLKRAKAGQLDTVPFRITGTTTDPRFTPDVNAILQTSPQPAAQQPRSLGGLLNRWFKKK